MKNIIWLQFCEYHNNNCEIIDFAVSKRWLQKQIKQPLVEFLENYTSNESVIIYNQAILDDKIIKYSKQL